MNNANNDIRSVLDFLNHLSTQQLKESVQAPIVEEPVKVEITTPLADLLSELTKLADDYANRSYRDAYAGYGSDGDSESIAELHGLNEGKEEAYYDAADGIRRLIAVYKGKI